MFKDYYAILGISIDASQEDIKSAYRKQSLKWHPDKNVGRNTEEQMKDVNEAYSILGNTESRTRYDTEYRRFKAYKSSRYNTNDHAEDSHSNSFDKTQGPYQSNDYDFDIKDEDLRNDINNARKSAEDYVKNFYSNLKADSKLAARGAWRAIKSFLIIFSILMGLSFLLGIISAIIG